MVEEIRAESYSSCTVVHMLVCQHHGVYLKGISDVAPAIIIYPTVNREVDGVFPVPRRERGVFADVGGLVGQAQRREGDGGVLQIRSPPPHRAVLEGYTVPVRRGHRHTQGGVGDRHVLLAAVDQLLPCYLNKTAVGFMVSVVDFCPL